MPKIPGTDKRIRRRAIRKAVWVMFSAFATLAMVATTVAPNLVTMVAPQ
jgi:hypothetical protein